MSTSPEQVAELISGYTDLKKYFEKNRQDIEQRVSAKENQVDDFLRDATPESRFIKDITIGGSSDFFYPVWFNFPDNSHGTSKLTFSRHYSWNGSENERPLDEARAHQAALLLELEGNAYPWNGDANFLEIKRFHERYNPTVSHVSFAGYSLWEATGTNKTYRPTEHELNTYSPRHSTVYLRGGGLKYRIIKNWSSDDIHYSDSQDRVNIYTSGIHGTWYVLPIPIDERIAPDVRTNAFVDPV